MVSIDVVDDECVATLGKRLTTRLREERWGKDGCVLGDKVPLRPHK